MSTGRMEAFSDGVIAILITVMVLELPVPHGTTWAALHKALPVLLTYVLSFVYLGIYWNNHHHMLHMTERVSGSVLWANLHLLFWLSLFPFGTAWMGESHLAALPTALYGFFQMMAGIAYFILKTALIAAQGPHSRLEEALGSDFKGKFSVVIYFAAIPLAWTHPWISMAMYLSVAAMWLIPDRRIEHRLAHHA
jgi:uncharacterized membrane protein